MSLSEPVTFAFCASNSLLQGYAEREVGEGRVSEWGMVWSVPVGTLNWGI